MQLTSSLFTSKPLRPLILNYNHYLGFCKPGVGIGRCHANPEPCRCQVAPLTPTVG